MPTTFKVVVGLEYYALACVSPVSVQGDPVLFGEPAFVDVAGIKYWCHFDPDGYLPDEEGEPTPEQLADAVEQAAGEQVLVYMVGHGNPSKVELLEDGFEFEAGDGSGEGESDPPDEEDDDGEDPEDLAGVDEIDEDEDGVTGADPEADTKEN